MFYYAVLYCFVIFALGLIRHQRLALFCAALFCFIFAALRFDSGYDYPVYYLAANGYISKDFEFLTRLLVSLSHGIHGQLFFLLSSLLIVVLIWRSLVLIQNDLNARNEAHDFYVFSFLAFLSFPVGFIDSLGYVRQYMGIAFFVLAFLLVGRSFIFSLCVFFLGFVSHFSVIVFLPLLLIARFLDRIFPIYFYFVLFLLAAAFGDKLIYNVSCGLDLYCSYFSSLQSDNGGKVFFLFVGVAMFFLFNISCIRENRLISRSFNAFFLGVCLYAALYSYGMHLARISWYLLPFSFFVAGYVISRKTPFEKLVFGMLCTMLFFSFFYFSAKNADRNFLNNYQIYLFVGPHDAKNLMWKEYDRSFMHY